jgi:hypothetical protein
VFPAPFIVILDANVLFPFTLRDTLLRAAAADYFQLRWSKQILDEMERNIVAKAQVSPENAVKLRSTMERFFPEAQSPTMKRSSARCRTTRRIATLLRPR